MEGLFTLDNFITLGMLTLLQMVLGLDNLLYISMESKQAPEDQQKRVRVIGIGLAILLRIVFLFVLVSVIDLFKDPIFGFNWGYFGSGEFSVHSLIVIAGGIFVIYTSVKEIWHMMSFREHEKIQLNKTKSVTKVIISIIIMNLVFSFDSILSAIALTNVLWVMTVAIVIGGLLMIWLSGKVTEFLKKNRMYEVLGLFILFIVGIMLMSEGGHLAHLELFESEITPMSKGTFYFVLVTLVVIDIVQGRYQKKIAKGLD